MIRSNKVNQSIEIVGPAGQEFNIKTYKIDGVYYLETSQVVNGLSLGFKISQYTNKEGLFEYRDKAYHYLKDKGIW